MTKEKILEVIGLYREKFMVMGVCKSRFPHEDRVRSVDDALAHCNDMLDRMEAFIEENRIEKAFRWLGFIQGVLWMQGIYTLEELRDHSRSDLDAPSKPAAT